MDVVLNVAVPIFAIIAAGYLAGRTVLGQEASQGLSSFVFWFALPAVLFQGMAQRSLAEIFNLSFIGALLLPMVAVYGLGWVMGRRIRRDREEVHAIQGLNACFSNTGYMGIPLMLAAYGPDRVLPALIATVIMSVAVVGMAVVSLELVRVSGRGLGQTLWGVIRALVKNPLIVSTVAGLSWNLSGLPLPGPVVTFCQLSGAAAGPCALFGIGVFLAGRPLSINWREIGWMVPLKLIVQPLLSWLLIITIFPLDHFWTGATLMLAALPTGALVFVMATQYRSYVEATAQVILLSTIASLPVLSLILILYGGR